MYYRLKLRSTQNCEKSSQMGINGHDTIESKRVCTYRMTNVRDVDFLLETKRLLFLYRKAA